MILEYMAKTVSKPKHYELLSYGFDIVGLYPPAYVDMLLDQVNYKEPIVFMIMEFNEVMHSMELKDAPPIISSIMNSAPKDQKVVYSMKLQDLLSKKDVSHLHKDISALVSYYETAAR